MKLRNKKTGEIREVYEIRTSDDKDPKLFCSLTELNAEWEDYEEPKEDYIRVIESFINYVEEADESFYCDESVKKFVEKLKAWKRLKDKKFKFRKWRTADIGGDKYYFVIQAEADDADKADLDLLFGGEQ